MAGADLSFVTVGLSFTVANGFPPLQGRENKSKSCDSLWQSLNTLVTWIFVSCVRSLTLEREPLHCHWQQIPVIKMRKEKKRPLKIQWTKRRHPTQTTTVTTNSHPPSSCEESHHTGLMRFVISCWEMSKVELWNTLKTQTQSSLGPESRWSRKASCRFPRLFLSPKDNLITSTENNEKAEQR